MAYIRAVLELARWREYYGVVVFLSLLGVFFGVQSGPVEVVGVLGANLASAAFAFMINDVEDFQDDAKDSRKRLRNPISAGRLNPKIGMLTAYFTAGISAILYMLAGTWTFVFGGIGLVLGYLYSSKRVRLKSMPVLDVVSHGFFLGTVYFLTVATANGQVSSLTSVGVVGLGVFLISVLGDLVNEIRDFAVDKKTGIVNTVQVLGLQHAGGYLSPLATLLGVSVFGFVFWQLPLAAKILSGLYGLFFAGHFLWHKYKHRTDVYSYPYQQLGLAGMGMAMIISRI